MMMSTSVARQVQELVDLETTGWNTKNPDLFLSMIHPDMV
jgi:ketosteroid isomerase-like protein